MRVVRVSVIGILLLCMLVMAVFPPLVVLSHREVSSGIHGKNYLTIDVCSLGKGDLVNDYGGFITVSMFVLMVTFGLFFFLKPFTKSFISLNSSPPLRPPEAFL